MKRGVVPAVPAVYPVQVQQFFIALWHHCRYNAITKYRLPVKTGRWGDSMLKYDFAIQTRSGQKIDSIVIAGRDQADAERKLVQMYRHCTILKCAIRRAGEKSWQASSMEDILTLISK